MATRTNRARTALAVAAGSVIASLIVLAAPVASAQPRNVEFRLGSAAGKPRHAVEVPLVIRSDEPFQGFELSIDFDEGVLEADDVVDALPDVGPRDFAAFHFDNDDDTPGNGGVDEGFVGGRVVVDADANVLPAAEDVEVLRIVFVVAEGASEGPTAVSFAGGASGFGITFENAVIADGVSVTPAGAESFALVAGAVDVLQPGPTFVRGDVNSDGVVTISDSHFMLNWLFRNLVPDLPCMESGEVAIDGRVNVSDAVAILNYLFEGAEPPAAPFPEAGSDVDDNGIDCEANDPVAPIEDSAARIVIPDVAVAVERGEVDRVPLTVNFSSSTSIGGFTWTVAGDVPIFRRVDWVGIDNLQGSMQPFFEHVEVDGDRFRHSVLFSARELTFLPPGDDTAVRYSVCLEDGVAAGDYALGIEDAELVDYESGRAIYPAVAGGTLAISEDVAAVFCGPLPGPGPGDSSASYRLDETSGGPGDEVCVPFLISTTSEPTKAFSYSVDFDETVLDAVATLQVWQIPPGVERSFSIFEHDNDDRNAGSGGLDEGLLVGAFVVDLIGPTTIPTDEGSVEVLRFVMRIEDDAPPGVTRLRFLDGGVGTGQPVLNSVILGDAVTNVVPSVANGAITILDAAIGDADCTVGIDPSDTPRNIEFGLGDAAGGPGQLVGIPFSIRADRASQGFEFSIDFDEELLEATDIVKRWERPDGTSYDFATLEFDNQNRVPGNHGVDEGFLVGAAIASIEDTDAVLPPDEDVEVLRFVLRIDESARPGVTPVRFEDGAIGSGGGPVGNKLIAGGTRVTPELADSFVFIDGAVNILPDGILFIRGDSNDDGDVNIADPRYVLDFLFLGSRPPPCADAADANDDGRIDISDPLATLNFLFLGATELPPPFLGAGVDPTPDGLDCSG